MKKISAVILCAAAAASLTACGVSTNGGTDAGQASSEALTETTGSEAAVQTTETQTESAAKKYLTKEDISIKETIENSEDGGHAILADGESASYSNVQVTKTGEADGDDADFYGENAAVFATNGGTLDLGHMVIETNGNHANAVFSYGEGTTVNISDSFITTDGNCSGGIMTTGGAVMNADNLTVHTTGRSSAAIRSDRGGGTVTVNGGSYTADGSGSPAIYSTADITVNDARLESTSAQGVVVEGKNSVTLNDTELIADNNTKNSEKSDYFQAVMIYQSMSGDADEGTSSFEMNGGTLTNKNGDIFFVNNTVTEIDLTNATITNEDTNGVFLRAAAAGWGNEGSNGGQVTLTASDQVIDGDMLVDSVSNLNLYLTKGSTFTGSVNPDGQAGEVYVEIDPDSKWVLTSDAYITGLTCSAGAIDLNGQTLYVNGTAYDGGASMGEAIEATVSTGGGAGSGGSAPGGAPGSAPDGAPGSAPDGAPSGTPPAKPEE